MADEAADVLDPTATADAIQEAIDTNPVLAIPDQEASVPLASQLAESLKDILPVYWDKAHPSANLFQKAQDALEAFAAQQK